MSRSLTNARKIVTFWALRNYLYCSSFREVRRWKDKRLVGNDNGLSTFWLKYLINVKNEELIKIKLIVFSIGPFKQVENGSKKVRCTEVRCLNGLHIRADFLSELARKHIRIQLPVV